MHIKKYLNSRLFLKSLTSLCFLSALTIESSALASTAPHEINCHFPLTEPALNIRPFTVTEWANYAVTHAFTYNYKDYIAQFTETKSCFTPSGWAGFSKAMKDSKNLETMEKEELFVSAKINGETKVIAQFRDNSVASFWLVRVPITIIYHNKSKESSQDMTVDLNIKTTHGNPQYFGINQMIARIKIKPKPIVLEGKPAKPEKPEIQNVTVTINPNNPMQQKVEITNN